MTDDEVEVLRELSRAAFQQRYRLEVMLAVADSEDGLVSLTDLATRLGLPASNVQGALRSLIDTGLLTELPQGDSRRKFLLRSNSAAWDWARELRVHAETVVADRSLISKRVRPPHRQGSR